MSEPRRLLVLALDAASPERIREWAADGSLPNIAALMGRGTRAATESVEGVYVGASWPSFVMGRGPGSHGVYWLDRILPGTYRRQRADGPALAPFPALWDVLSDAGHRCVVLDVPLTPFSDRVTGPQVVEWGVHDAVFGFRTRPPELAAEIEARHGRHPAPAHCDADRSPEEARRFAEQLAAGAAARAGLTLDLLERTPDWRFAIQTFSETHCSGHQLWHTHDPAHPCHDPAGDDLLLQVFRAVDEAIGRIVDGVGPDTTVAVLALHGMGPAGGHGLLLQEVLQRLGLEVFEGGDPPEGAPMAVQPPPAPAPAPGAAADPAVGSAAGPSAGPSAGHTPRDLLRWGYRRLVPTALRERVYAWRQERNQRRGEGSPLGLDAARTRAFYVGLGVGPPFSSIRLNLAGREPGGIVRPGAEADALIDELVGHLEALTDVRTGAPAVARVIRTDDLHPGERRDWLPDLLVEWTMTPPRGTTAAGLARESLWAIESPALGRIEARNDYCRTGEHRRGGWVVVAGAGARSAEVDRTLSVLDMAPTFAAMLGCEMPDREGEVVAELLDEAGR
ncbi:alkaline phosphatase family protein [Gaopeijia maritima]|uniref:Alkaline phosphatase family protein n=1 Tax=Gaopeijia maritima TaxID=3119007 RepID=A0ABU9ED62_9BACT